MKERVIALGFFDGVHLGHAALLRRTVEGAAARGVTPAVFTFDRVRREVGGGMPCPLIDSPEDRAGLVRRLYGIRDVIMVRCDEEMRTTYGNQTKVNTAGATHRTAASHAVRRSRAAWTR